MDIALELRRSRLRAGLSQRELAALAGTSQATVSAYESRRKVPSLATSTRLLGAMGQQLRVAALPGGRSRAELVRAGDRLADVLALAEALPFRRPGPLRFPALPTA